jgi:GNAT superfamily N-acetyltransferase
VDAVVRAFEDSDAEAAAAVVRAVAPGFLVTGTLVLHWLRGAAPEAQLGMWVAEHEGDVVAWAEARFDWSVSEPGAGEGFIAVLPAVRRRGIGSELYGRCEEHLVARGARKLATSVVEGDEDGRRFAEARGFEATRRERLSTLDPRRVRADRAEAPAGFRVVSLRELLDRPAELHALYAEAARDVPSDEPHDRLGYDEWLREIFGNPLLDPDASAIVLDGDRPVALAWLLVDRESGLAEHELTGTLRAYRGRGLATLAKLAAIRWCAENGVTELLTDNDAENAPMLAINDRLGYRPTYVYVEYAREL